MSPQPVPKILREILGGHGVVMSTRHGPFGPADVEKEMLAGATKEQALDTLVRRILSD